MDDLHDCRGDVHPAERALAADDVAAAVVVEAINYQKKNHCHFSCFIGISYQTSPVE